MKTSRTLSRLLLALALAGCAHPPPTLPPGLADARFVLLGEVHDNPRHHRLRAEWLQALLADGRPTRVVFEQLDATRDAALNDARNATPADSHAIALAGGLDGKAWRWPLHQPLFDAALAGRAELAGGNLPRERIRAVVREGSVPAGLRPLLDAPGWTAQQQRDAEADIAQGHCGALPAAQIAPMALAQRVRDARMAQAMLAAPAGSRVVLIAGNGHVRRDRGVPHYLRAAGVPNSAIVAVALVEEGDNPSVGAYDQLQQTVREPRPDPCEAFKQGG
ncbi:MAG TPA: ChaN family lipoprotein [Ideonella sp.]|uniref:ChaN family lipoprotein n=1 Tax=Ideonella sp. TaxID=1929293 RepID=UPI002E31065A|nr:ChaN family lipoprotein [Ideonella sp.]HEX5686863.1 ChaN family lipoprotein [Ideonella sp.]